MARDISKTPIWHDIIARLNKARVDYVLVGASALVVHGLPRSTVDIDIYVPAKEDVLKEIFEICAGLRLESEQSAVVTLASRPDLFSDRWICFTQAGEPVLDVYFAPARLFAKLRRHARWKGDDQFKVLVASLNDIAAMKMASNRPVDQADLAMIKKAKQLRRLHKIKL